jgi:hypothetical protein
MKSKSLQIFILYNHTIQKHIIFPGVYKNSFWEDIECTFIQSDGISTTHNKITETIMNNKEQ